MAAPAFPPAYIDLSAVAASQAASTAAALARDQAQAAALTAGVRPYIAPPAVPSGISAGAYYFMPAQDGRAVVQLYQNVAGTGTLVSPAIEVPTAGYLSIPLGSRSGYTAGIIGSAGRVLLGFRSTDGRPIFGYGGDVVGRIEGLEGTLGFVSQPRAGVMAGIQAPGGALPLYVDSFNGRVWLNGRDPLAEIDALGSGSGGAAAVTADFPSDDLVAVGDSLTNGATSGNWPAKLAALTGQSLATIGFGGQGVALLAALQGGTPARITLPGNQLPADTGAVTVAAITRTPAPPSTSVAVTIAGIACTLTRDAASGHTLARVAAGAVVPVSAGTKVIPVQGALYRDRTMIIGVGKNSYLPASNQPMTPAQIVSDIRAMIETGTARVKRAIVWGIPPSSNETTGSADRATLDACNAAIAAAFPDRFLDLAAWLRTPAAAAAAGITFTTQDNTDIANGVIPTSLRQDPTHFSDAGGTAAAFRFNQELQLRGWR